MNNKNVPAVPEYDSNKIIEAINKKVCVLYKLEKKEIAEIINYHSCEASVIAERISEYLGVSYQSIFDLL